MTRALLIARREFWALVRTKGFLMGLLLAPLLGVASFLLAPDETAAPSAMREVDIVDSTGRIAPALVQAAESVALRVVVMPATHHDDAARGALLSKVRRGELLALVEVTEERTSAQPTTPIRVFANNLLDNDVRWLRLVLRDIVVLERLRAQGVDEAVARSTLDDVPILMLPPDPEGATETSALVQFFAPFVMTLLLLMAVMSTAPYLLHSVVEEKQQRIAEVLLGSVTPFELMLGKLLGTTCAGVLAFALYLATGLLFAFQFDAAGAFAGPWLLLLLLDVILAMMLFGALFLAAGAASTELRDAQALMTPVLLCLMFPLLALGQLVTDPDGALSVALSIFPLTAPMILPFRLVASDVPAWQTSLSIGLAVATTALSVGAAGRIFRIGILAQGKAPRWQELVQWLRKG